MIVSVDIKKKNIKKPMYLWSIVFHLWCLDNSTGERIFSAKATE